jgi:hypothetical protein
MVGCSDEELLINLLTLVKAFLGNGELCKIRATKDLDQIDVLRLFPLVEMRAGNNTPKVFRLQIVIIAILYKQPINSITLLKVDLDVLIIGVGFCIQELFDFFNLHMDLFL